MSKTLITSENIHVWINTQGHYMASNENNKRLYHLLTLDDCVNCIWLAGYEQSAREINEHFKQERKRA